MALRQQADPKSEPKSAPEQPGPVLELALYKIYTWQGNTYEKGKPYRFNYADAMLLLAEQDHDRAVWRLYQKPVKREAPKEEVVDATRVRANVPESDLGFMTGNTRRDGKGRIEIGSDDEIQDLLQPSDDGNVTV